MAFNIKMPKPSTKAKRFWSRSRKYRPSIKGQLSQTRGATNTLRKYRQYLTREQYNNLKNLGQYFPEPDLRPVETKPHKPRPEAPVKIYSITEETPKSVTISLQTMNPKKDYWSVRNIQFPNTETDWFLKEQWLEEQQYQPVDT